MSDTPPPSKPAFLKRVRIRGYKSIEYCDVTLEPLTVLVGRNGAGKSNFLEALQLIRDVLALPYEIRKLSERGGWSAIATRWLSEKKISFDLILDSYPNQVEVHLVLADKKGEFVLLDEKCTILNVARPEHRWVMHRSAEGVTKTSGDEDLRVLELLSNPEFSGLTRGKSAILYARYFHQFVLKLRLSDLYRLHADSFRELSLAGGDDFILAQDGSNITEVVRSIIENRPSDHSRIEQYMAAIVPSFRSVRPVSYGEYETLQFVLAADPSPGLFDAWGGPDGKPRPFDARSVSDGTLRALAILVATFQHDPEGGYPGFVAIEEPETALHPAAMHALVDALDEATLRTQILLSTHSPDLLDHPAVRPENVRVVEMIDGRTVIAPVDAAGVEIVRRKLNTLGGLEREGSLAPDLADVERQRREAGARPA